MQAQSVQWDDKFGVINHHEFDDLKEAAKETKVAIEGVGADAEIVTNSKGGKQSKSPMAMHLIDPQFLEFWADDRKEAIKHTDADWVYYEAIRQIADFMQTGIKGHLLFALDAIEMSELQQVTRIAKVLQYGASRYAPNNWRLIPQEEHINHALIHIIAHLAGDTQDEHLDHALCRLMMAYATEKSDDFDYGSFVDTNKRG